MNKIPDEETVVWTPNMPDRRLAGRRSGIDRRAINGRSLTVPDLRSSSDRREGEDRRKVRLTITGRAIDIK